MANLNYRGGPPVYRTAKNHFQLLRPFLYLTAHPEYDSRQDRYIRSIIQQLRREITDRELQCMVGYYVCRIAQPALGDWLGINTSTVCRNIMRGERKFQRVLSLANEISPIRGNPEHGCKLPENADFSERTFYQEQGIT